MFFANIHAKLHVSPAKLNEKSEQVPCLTARDPEQNHQKHT